MISSLALFAIMVLISADVIGRAFFDTPVMGTYELGQTLMVCVVFFGISHVQMVQGNVTVDTFVSKLPPTGRLIFPLFASLIGFIVFALMTYSSGKLAWMAYVNKRTIQGLLGLPLYPSKFVVTIGAATLTVFYFIDLVNKIGQWTLLYKGSKAQ
jgi:TRAP-type C4-dicarboxylate transport system permease small subunit